MGITDYLREEGEKEINKKIHPHHCDAYYVTIIKIIKEMAQATAPAGGLKRQTDEVKTNAIFRESARKEQQHRFLNENFDFNPKNLVAITDKPTRKFDMGERNPDDEVLLTKLGTLTQLPKQKFSYPMTAA